MYRVLLKVERVCLRIKQSVELYIQVRRNQRQFAHCHNHTLINGELSLTNTSQFFIYAKEPSFSIEIIMVIGQTKKKGGVAEINLKNFVINSSHRIKVPILQIPIPNCSMQLDFVFLISSKAFQGNEMHSTQQLQNFNHEKYLETFSTQHSKQLNQNIRLKNQIQRWELKNQTLQIETKLMQQKQKIRVQERKKNIEDSDLQLAQCERDIERQKQQIAKIMVKINQSKNQQLISQAQVIINRRTRKHTKQ